MKVTVEDYYGAGEKAGERAVNHQYAILLGEQWRAESRGNGDVVDALGGAEALGRKGEVGRDTENRYVGDGGGFLIESSYRHGTYGSVEAWKDVEDDTTPFILMAGDVLQVLGDEMETMGFFAYLRKLSVCVAGCAFEVNGVHSRGIMEF